MILHYFQCSSRLLSIYFLHRKHKSDRMENYGGECVTKFLTFSSEGSFCSWKKNCLICMSGCCELWKLRCVGVAVSGSCGVCKLLCVGIVVCGSCSVLESTCDSAALCASGLLVQAGCVVWESRRVGHLLCGGYIFWEL